jgi:hypothetical protein
MKFARKAFEVHKQMKDMAIKDVEILVEQEMGIFRNL